MENASNLVNGKKVSKARELVVKWLKENNLLEKEEEITHNIATAERTGGIIEPLPKLQWFISMNTPIPSRNGKTLKELMRDAVASKKISILPERFEKEYFHWIDNLHDWCISRQLWYGHKIPIDEEEDTLDTWFSSALWTFSTLGWPHFAQSATRGKPGPENDLANYHPTDVLETGYDILFFWVAKMIMMSEFLLGEIPFKTVYLHGLVRNERGEKLSKSLGDNVDPLNIINQYGADALRMALIVGVGPGADSKLSAQKLKAYKHFANKVWNISRFVLSKEKTGKIDTELKKEFDALAQDITNDMEAFRFHLAAEKIYAYVWHRFADEIIEKSKKSEDKNSALYYILENSLKLLHPFMPFVTEEIWGLMENKKLLMIEKWPV
jgi:valyl-tRNA synthetase